MSTFNQLETLITEANAALDRLEETLDELENAFASLTLVAGSPNQEMVFRDSDATGTFYRLTQSTPNDGNEYTGRYKLPSVGACSAVERVSIISHSNPAAPDSPARVLPPGADPVTGWVNLVSVLDLIGKSFVEFILRSAIPFEVNVGLLTCPAATINFVTASSTVQEGTPHTVAVRLSLSIGSTPQEIRVPIIVTGGSATSGSDYTLQTSEVVFPVGSVNGATQNVSLSIAPDLQAEPAETIVLSLGAITGTAVPGTTASHIVTIAGYACSQTETLIIDWNTPAWLLGNPHRAYAGTPVGQYDSRETVGGAVEYQLAQADYLQKVDFKQVGSSGGVWNSARLRIDGVDYGTGALGTGGAAWQWIFDVPVWGQIIRLEGVTWNVANYTKIDWIRATRCLG